MPPTVLADQAADSSSNGEQCTAVCDGCVAVRVAVGAVQPLCKCRSRMLQHMVVVRGLN
jgi:hypothetical protein